MPDKKEKQELSEELKKEYESLSKKYNLPSFDEMNNDFEILTLENNQFLLRNIRKNIEEKLEFCVKTLNSILQPDQTITDLSECRMFNDKAKKEIFELYKKLMILTRASDSLSISSTEKEEADYILFFYAEWSSEKGIRKKLKEMLKNMEKSWESHFDIPEETGYMG